MKHHVSWLTAFLNKILGKYALTLLATLHIKLRDPANPIPEHVVMSLVVVLLAMVGVLWLRSRLSVERPGAAQQVAEFLLTNPLGFGIRDLLDENAGHAGRKFLPLVGSISVFILLSNLLSVIPAFTSPTVHPSVPLGCAICTFLYFNWQGIRHHGPIGYTKHFAGPVWWLSPLMFPVELISTSARLLSLTVRLWANIFSSELLYVIFLGLLIMPVTHVGAKIPVLGVALGIFPATIPVIFIGLHMFVAVIQTYVFTILPSIYLGLATAEEH
jgi:F-type H+-transporting ATPase subunit a